MANMRGVLKNFLGIPLTLLSFLFILKILYDARTQLLSSFYKIDFLIFLLSILFFAIFFYLKSFVWIEIMKKRGSEISKKSGVYPYSAAEFKRYIPGSFFAFLSRMETFKKLDIPRRQTAKGIVVEAIILALTAFVFSLPSLYFILIKKTFFGLDKNFSLGLVVLFFLIFAFLLFKFYKVVVFYIDIAALSLFSWLIYSLASFFALIAITHIRPENFLLLLSIFVMSWLVGYLSFVTPMGLGIREVVLTFALSFFVTLPVAAVFAVLARVSMILGELLQLTVSRIILKLKDSNFIFKINPYFTIVAITFCLYFFYLSFYTVLRYNNFHAGRFDLGNMSQTVWNTSHGNIFMLTDPDGTAQISRLADHADFILVLLSPLYFIWSDPRILLIFQTFVLAFGGVFVFKIANLILKKPKISTLLAVSFYLNFWVWEENIFDFHPVALATTFFLVAFYFLLKKRYLILTIFLLLAALTKENVFLVVSIFGLYFFFIEKRRKIGLILIIIPFFIFCYLVGVAIPNTRGHDHFALSYYSYLGNNFSQIVKNIILKPNLVVKHVFTFSTLSYLNTTFISTGYLALLFPFALIFALPDLLISILSSNPGLRSYQYHYGSLIVPFVYVSAIYGISKILHKFENRKVEKIIFYYLLIFTIISTYIFSPLIGMRNEDNSPYLVRNAQKLDEYLSIIPKSASVAASNSIGSKLSDRNTIYVVPNGINTADYVVFFHEKSKLTSQINLSKYTLLISDKSFNLYKKENPNACFNCNP